MSKKKDDSLDKFIENIEGGLKSGSGKTCYDSQLDFVKDNLRKLKHKNEQKRIEYVSKAVGKRILDLCNENGYSVNYLSEVSEVTQSTVSNIVAGKSKNISIITITKLCECFCITLEEFFTDPLFEKFMPY